MSFTDSLRGYGYPVHKRDRFLCQYCGLDGSNPDFSYFLGASGSCL